MNSFLKSIEKRFTLLNESIDLDANTEGQDVFEEDELEEQNTTSAVAGYDIPAAFSKRGADDDTVEQLGYKRVKRNESVNTPPTYKTGIPQKPEADEEEYTDKFLFSDDSKWQHENYEYPSKPYAKSYKKYSDRSAHVTGTQQVQYDWSGIKNKTDKVYEAMDSKYEQLIESYKQFAIGDAKSTPEQKVKNTIKEVAKKLQEIETLVNHTSRLKTEAGLSRTNMGISADKALTKISERLIKISERVRALGE
jgi:hypothetical protein